jgi:hypothetical protein
VKRSYAERKELKRVERENSVPKVSFKRESSSDVIARELEKLEKCSDWVEHRYDHEYEKERCNLSRASNTILELAMCNDWDWFATFTVKKELMDRYDLPSLNRKFSLMIRDLNDKFNCEIKYLSVPETHKDGAWHLHVMLSGVPDKLLKDFHMKPELPLVIFVMSYAKKWQMLRFVKKEDLQALSKSKRGFFLIGCKTPRLIQC